MNEAHEPAREPDVRGDAVTSGSPEDARTLQLLRGAGVVEQPPSPHVWEAIRTALRADRADRMVHSVTGDTDARHRSGEVRDLRRVRRGTRSGRSGMGPLQLLAAAAVGALVTWGGLALTGSDDAAPVLASGVLESLSSGGEEGSAEVIEVDGEQRLRVQLNAAPDAGDGYLEVWLLRPDVSGMMTLGVLDGTTGEYLLPAGIDLAEYAVVDISREHMDGDPSHGGDSLVRGAVDPESVPG